MENIVFERNYEKPKDGSDHCTAIFDQAVEGGFFQRYCDMMNKVPKIIVPQDKENYEYLLNRCQPVCRTALRQDSRCCELRAMGFYHRPVPSHAGI